MKSIIRATVKLTILGGVIALLPSVNHDTADIGVDDGTLLDRFSNFKSHNFLPRDNFAREGLDIILSGRAMGPTGLPWERVRALSLLTNFESNPLGDATDRWLRYGIAPSPAILRENLDSEDLGLGVSKFSVEKCRDERTGTDLIMNSPANESQGDTSCTGDERVAIIRENCFVCHANFVAGNLVAGISNAHIDIQALTSKRYKAYRFLTQQDGLSRLVRRFFLGASLTDLERDITESWLDYQSMLLKLDRSANARGDNTVALTSFIYTQHVDPNGSGLSLRSWRSNVTNASPVFYRYPTVDAQPWYLRKFKPNSTWYGLNEDSAAGFSVGFQSPHLGQIAGYDQFVLNIEKVLKYVESATSPNYPHSIDFELAEKGRVLFHEKRIEVRQHVATCSKCHGSYFRIGSTLETKSWLVRFPGELAKRVDVGTDREYIRSVKRERKKAKKMAALSANKIKSYLRTHRINSTAPDFPAKIPDEEHGILPPPLVGVWASAPYFHNGSVPTLYGVLRGEQFRPTVWARSLDPYQYDFEKVGLSFKTRDPTEVDFTDNTSTFSQSDRLPRLNSINERRAYDTRKYGKGNRGHNFAATWSDPEIYAVIEFLKSLSGDNIIPEASRHKGNDLDTKDTIRRSSK